MKTLCLTLFLFLLILTVSSVNAQSTLALQEKCAIGAKAFLLDRIGSYGGQLGFFNSKAFGQGYLDYTSHYNRKADKCFIRIEFHSFATADRRAINIIDIWDVFEGIDFARLSYPMLFPEDCLFNDKKCTSASEFEALIKPYMEE